MNNIFLNRTIGLLGGSFNPAHEGHVHISVEARKRLGISSIWWLVSPQNPLKSTSETAAFSSRIETAKKLTAQYHFIKISDLEMRLNTRYTIDTLRKLKNRFPRVKFIWLMGADNLATIHHWQEWKKIFSLVPVLVLDRSPFSHSALRKKAAIRFAKNRKLPREMLLAANKNLPAWSYVHMKLHPDSSTSIRRKMRI